MHLFRSLYTTLKNIKNGLKEVKCLVFQLEDNQGEAVSIMTASRHLNLKQCED